MDKNNNSWGKDVTFDYNSYLGVGSALTVIFAGIYR
jgi:hypothetical protein